jgi:hypothetical protein
MARSKGCVPGLLTGALLLGSAGAASAEARPTVVELFTSQGCSSCPPADAYIGELAGRSDVLALTYHVQYWDDLGWRDRFGLPEATQRQQQYAHSLHHTSVYTPQAIIDGTVDAVGSDRRSIGARLAAPRTGVAIATAVLNGQIVVNLGPQANVPSCDVTLVAYLRSAVSRIGRGENAGHTLMEFNVVRGMLVLGRWDGQAREYRTRVDSLPADATNVAVLVQPAGPAPIIGAATITLR